MRVKKILIMDDEAEVRRLVRMSLEPDGYEFEEAESGEEALTMAKALKPDLVILDLMMPDRWGYVVCEQLKHDPETRKIPVMFLTARAGHLSRKMGKVSGGDEYVVKPFKPKDLRARVKTLLGLD
jgi:two-component system, OmpR family, phosphate regulon response regulator PhoB